MYAIIETGGKQYRVSEGDIIRVEKLNEDIGTKVEFDEVLLVKSNEDVKIGAPNVAGAMVSGEIMDLVKGDKIRIFKHKAKKHYQKRTGHRQKYTLLKIVKISA